MKKVGTAKMVEEKADLVEGRVDMVKTEMNKIRNITPRKVVAVCQKCGTEFVAEAKTRVPLYCNNCRRSSGKWEVIGYEDTKFGKVRIEKRDNKIRKVLVE